ncbi:MULTISPECIES: thiamine phosphate synthase [Gracilibacillus]|uniref:thiamine phosphate synthase n=1 Tax=Gracilibacillus TaxID=74385 RepID=UPI000826425D|nr:MULTISPECIES: thiamine phosphate synthase [Gracilibacillus]
MRQELLQVYFIMGSNNTTEDPLHVLEQALQGGITMFQFREKGQEAQTGAVKQQLAREMKALCYRYQVPFIVNDEIDLALEIGADGVHVGQDDMPIQEVRARVPGDWLIGVSATNAAEAVQAKQDGADYIGVGPIYATSTKEDAKQPIGEHGVRAIREQIGALPLVAIGGIQQRHTSSLIEAGVDGVSIITAISQATDPKQAAAAFRASFTKE